MSKGDWGGSAAGSGLEFQAAVSALCMVHMARGTPLGWIESGGDIPLSVSAETGGAGDDVALQLSNGSLLEVQAKRKLQANSELWSALLALSRRAHEDMTFHGVLAVGPTTSVAIRDQLARDIIRIGQGREDDLSTLAQTFTKNLSEALIPLSVCNRVGASSFAELLDARLDASREKREQFRETLSKASAAITEENTRKAGLKAMEKEYDDRKKVIEKDRADLKSLVAKGSEERAKRLDAVSQAADAKRVLVEAAKSKVVAIGRLAEDVRDFRERRFGDILRELRTKRAEAGLSDADWQAFGLGFVGDVDSVLDLKLKTAQKALAALAGAEDPENPLDPGSKGEIPFISENSDLSAQTLFLLDKEVERLQKLVGTDAANSKRYSAISAKVTKDEAAQAKLLKQIEHVRGADARIKEQSEARRKAYAGVFESIIEEERELADLYRPIKERIDVGEGSLRKLSFSVKRKVALKSWAEQGERLLDLRKSGAFKGRGELLAAAQAKLGEVLATGGSSDASEALSAFVQENRDEFLRHMPDGEDMRTWGHGIAEWLYGSGHITVEYGLQYDGVDIEQLILSEVIGGVGEKPIYRYHLCNNWLFDYWKSRAYLTAFVAIAWKNGVHIRGGSLPSKEIKRIAEGEALLVSEDGNALGRYGKLWYPEDMALKPDDYLAGVDPELKGFGVKAALSLWLELEENGYMSTGLPMYSRESVRSSFEHALEKYNP